MAELEKKVQGKAKPNADFGHRCSLSLYTHMQISGSFHAVFPLIYRENRPQQVYKFEGHFCLFFSRSCLFFSKFHYGMQK